MTALWNVQKAVLAKLEADTALMGLVTGVYDTPEGGTNFPYVTIGEATENPFNTFDKKGNEITLTLHIYSRYEGFKEGLQILERLNAVLDYQPLTVGSNSTVYCRYENSITMTDFDRITKHIPARYKVVVQSA